MHVEVPGPPAVSDTPSLLFAVPGVLSWIDASALHRHLQHRHLELLRERFETMLAQFIRAGIGTRLQALTTDLPDEGRSRVLSAPESARRLLYEPFTDLRFFLTSVLAEHRRLDADVVLREPVWCALGDWRFPATRCRPGEPDQGFGGAVYQAPRLANGVPVDHRSPHAARAASGWTSPHPGHEADGMTRVLDKLRTALAVVRDTSPAAYALITASTRAIVVRKDLATAGSLVSFSTGHVPGRLGFLNLECVEVDVAATVDALVHEAIHSFLYLVEESCPLLDPRAAAATVYVTSPWSGRRLDLYSFVHACYVWFAIWRFWSLAPAAGAVPPERVDALAHRARRGFDQPAMKTALHAAASYLTPDARSLRSLVNDVHRGVFD